MPSKTLQEDPPEGSREVIDRELKRTGAEGQTGEGGAGKSKAQSGTETQKKNKAAMDKAAPQTGTRGGP
jgi:hypothetical protein